MEIRTSSEPMSCIYCTSYDIDAKPFDFETYERRVDCLSCGRYWLEKFAFNSIIVPEEYIVEVSDG